MRKIVTWVAVADSGRAHILENDGPGRGLSPVADAAWEASVPAGRDIMADRPGRSFDSKGAGRHAMEPASDPRNLEKEAFLSGVADHLGEAARKGRYDRLILVAAPTALGILRQNLPGEARAVLHGEVDKDLTKKSAADVATRLEGLMDV